VRQLEVFNQMSKVPFKAVVFQDRSQLPTGSHLFYILKDTSQKLIRVKLNRVFFPHFVFQARSLGCRFASA